MYGTGRRKNRDGALLEVQEKDEETAVPSLGLLSHQISRSN